MPPDEVSPPHSLEAEQALLGAMLLGAKDGPVAAPALWTIRDLARFLSKPERWIRHVARKDFPEIIGYELGEKPPAPSAEKEMAL